MIEFDEDTITDEEQENFGGNLTFHIHSSNFDSAEEFIDRISRRYGGKFNLNIDADINNFQD